MATRWDKVPGFKDDVVKRSFEDMDKVKKAANVNSSGLKGGARRSVIEAGGRGLARNIGRGALGQGALEAGYAVGRAIDEKTGAGKKIVDESGLGDLAERVANSRDKVELSEDAKKRIARGDLDTEEIIPAKKKSATSKNMSIEGKMYAGRNPEIDDDTRESAGNYKRGGSVVSKASSRADGIAQRGKTRGKYL
jgi:hypothetical protein